MNTEAPPTPIENSGTQRTLRYRMIVNPTARGGRTATRGEALVRALGQHGIDCDIVSTEAPGHAADLAATSAALGFDVVVAAGGDGTVHEVANGLLRRPHDASQPALGILPIGTGNDFAGLVCGIRSEQDALRALLNPRFRRVDVGSAQWDATEEFFVNGMGTGIDVEVVRNLQKRSRLPGGLLYLRALLRALVRFRPVQLRVEGGGRTYESEALMVAICNGRRIGGAFNICPDARPDDGLLDACIVDAMSALRIARTLPKVLAGTHSAASGVTMWRAQTFTFAVPAGPLFFQLDGELRQAAEPVIHVRALPGALRVVSVLP